MVGLVVFEKDEAVKKIRGAYRGASADKIRQMANIEPSHVKLRDMHSRLIQLSDPKTRQPLAYKALRKITGGYNGSSHRKLGFIANVEPIQAILDHA